MTFSLKDILPFWWAWAWRSFLLGFAGGVVLGFVVGFVLGLSGLSDLIPLASGLAGYVWGLAASLLMLAVALRKKYKGITINIVVRSPNQGVSDPATS